jgi:hypothetical protein
MANANVFAQAVEAKKKEEVAGAGAKASSQPVVRGPGERSEAGAERATSPVKNEMGGREVKVEDARSNSTLFAAVRAALGHLEAIPPPDKDPDVYKDWGDEEEFKAKVGKGECAGP